MIILYAVCILLAILVYAGLGMFAPKIALAARLLISIGIGTLVAGLASAWIYYAAHQMPPDAVIIQPAPKDENGKK